MKKYHKREIEIYQGVLSLIREGTNPYDIKVSDIALAAKLGKGTIYDYFKSKEEVISKAILYSMNLEMNKAMERILEKDNFKDKYYTVLNILKDNLENNMLMMNNLMNSGAMEEFYKDFISDENGYDRKMKMIKAFYMDLIDEAGKEGLGMDRTSDYKFFAIHGGIMAFTSYINKKENFPSLSMEEAMDMSYQLVTNALG